MFIAYFLQESSKITEFGELFLKLLIKDLSRENLLLGVRGVDGIFCILTDKIDKQVITTKIY